MDSFFNNAFSWIGDFFVELFTTLYTLFIALIDWIVETLTVVCEYIYNWFQEACFVVLEPVLSYINGSPFGSFDFLPTDLFQYLNFFFPLSELIAVLYILLSFWVLMLCVKILLKAIPTIY